VLEVRRDAALGVEAFEETRGNVDARDTGFAFARGTHKCRSEVLFDPAPAGLFHGGGSAGYCHGLNYKAPPASRKRASHSRLWRAGR
jgi:hypothetical protein